AQNGYHIFQLIKRKPFDEEEFERFRAELYNDLFEKKQNEIFNQWFEQAKKKARIKYHQSVKAELED
ncbi:MAG: hypothetical protein AB1765_10160, partial [Candidatus Hydrogenedentota bacterium]